MFACVKESRSGPTGPTEAGLIRWFAAALGAPHGGKFSRVQPGDLSTRCSTCCRDTLKHSSARTQTSQNLLVCGSAHNRQRACLGYQVEEPDPPGSEAPRRKQPIAAPHKPPAVVPLTLFGLQPLIWFGFCLLDLIPILASGAASQRRNEVILIGA